MKSYTFRVSKDYPEYPSQKNLRLDQVLHTLLNKKGIQISKSAVRQLVVSGVVYLNRKRVRIASKPVFKDATLEVFLNKDKLKTQAHRPISLSKNDIVFEDAHLIIVNKPSGIPTQPTVDEARANLFAAVKQYVKERDQLKGGTEPYIGLHHRLDRDTSGLILFTKTREANSPVAELFKTRSIQKTYFAICESVSKEFFQVGEKWCVENYLKSKKYGSRKKMQIVKNGGDLAITDFEILKKQRSSAPPFYFVQATPRTGRTHQIRVHLASSELPIVGDSLYGSAKKDGPRMLLHAARLTFSHPMCNKIVGVESTLPKDIEAFLENHF